MRIEQLVQMVDWSLIFQVQIATQRPGPAHQLHISKCHEMANHYLGFNGWSTRITSMVEVPGEGVCYQCTVDLEVRGCDGVSVGVGDGKVELENQSKRVSTMFLVCMLCLSICRL